MSRSPYEPPPDYRTCRYCKDQHDVSYGEVLCRGRALEQVKEIIRSFPNPQEIWAQAEISVKQERDEAETARRQALKEHKERELHRVRAQAARLEQELEALGEIK